MPHGPKETFHPFSLTQYRTPEALRDPTHGGFDFSMDVVQGSPHLGSHIDAFVHVQAEGRIFGGSRVAEVFGDAGWAQHGAETIPPLVTRGVLLDIAASEGSDRLPDGHEIDVSQLERASGRARLEIEQGDAVLFRTGKMQDYRRDADAYFRSGPGLGTAAAVWLDEHGVAAIGSDTTATEPVPFKDPAHTVHRVMLVDRGINLLEILDLEEVAAAGLTEFLFICLPLRIVGATGSWVRPVAVV
jgi:kynurenine formamidase